MHGAKLSGQSEGMSAWGKALRAGVAYDSDSLQQLPTTCTAVAEPSPLQGACQLATEHALDTPFMRALRLVHGHGTHAHTRTWDARTHTRTHMQAMIRTLRACREAANQITDAQLQLESMGFIADLLTLTENEALALASARQAQLQQQQQQQQQAKQELEGAATQPQSREGGAQSAQAAEPQGEGGGPLVAVKVEGSEAVGQQAAEGAAAAGGSGGQERSAVGAGSPAAKAEPAPPAATATADLSAAAIAASSEGSKLPQLLADAEDLQSQLEEW